MFDNLDADDLYAELIMLRANDTRAFILVEGSADCAVFDRFINIENFTTVPAQGKNRAQGAIERVHESDQLTAVYAVLDRDWVGLLDNGVGLQAVIYTDFYDLDACIFFAPHVYEALAASFCTDLSFRHGAAGCTREDIEAACVNLALPVGLLRFISKRDGLALNLRDFPLAKVTSNDSSCIDLTALITLACKRAGKEPEDHPGLLTLLQAELSRVTEKERYCSGHDLAKAFSLVAKRRWAVKAGHDVIERSARAALGRDVFEQMSIYRDCMHWAAIEGAAVWKDAPAPFQEAHTE
ncbi:hypothetical protein H3146_10675 [Streptomyces sp. OF3]|uniref:DUF4435 domain-containing protein n=1 Tax=Streptomyces alkaliterrae TaxID=2213162 RepID=A0A7W3ZMS3_9ACTN|nr:hypothetical protein [Streptomyces alkaliterrae]MBB1253825.1 hypothetical protein [Streptomyces alkaliterrae]